MRSPQGQGEMVRDVYCDLSETQGQSAMPQTAV